jgi:glycosyltransferase involved in cell wall biosynthesis
MKKINLLFVEENRDGTVGGSHYLLLDLINQIDDAKFNVQVLFYEKNKLVDLFEKRAEVLIVKKPHGCNIVKNVKTSSPLYYLLKTIQVIINFFTTVLFPLISFIRIILTNDIHIIQLNDTVFSGFDWVLAAKITRRKIIAHERGIHTAPPRQLFFSPSFHTTFFDHILGMSESTRHNMQELNVDLTNRYTTFYDRLDISAFTSRVKKHPDTIRAEFNVPENAVLIGIVGNIKRWKGQLVVIDSVKLLADKGYNLFCLIVGDHSRVLQDDLSYFAEIEGKITNNGLGNIVKLTGHRSDVPDIMNTLDIVIHASTLPEPFGMVILEGMALGKPVIAAASGGPLEIIQNDISGILVPPGDPVRLSESVGGLISNPQKRKSLGMAAKERIQEKFSKLDMKFLEELYVRLASR